MYSIIELKIIGQYSFDPLKRLHVIRISPKKSKIIQEDSMDENIYTVKNVDKNGEKYQAISTTLHELKHAMQKEEMGQNFWDKKYACAKDIKNSSLSDFYSQCEVEARSFENLNIIAAIEFYNKFLPKSS